MNENCENLSCPVPKNAVQDYLNQYSLNQVVVKNSEFVAVINGIPVTIPAGTFEYPISASTGSVSPLTFQGCQSLISVPVPPGSSFSDIQALVQGMLNKAAQQQAQCNAAAVPSAPTFFNQQVSVASSCTTPELTISSSLPPGVTQSGNSLVCAAGVFGSNISQVDANNLAGSFLSNLISKLFSTGSASCGHICPDLNSSFNTTGVNQFFMLSDTASKRLVLYAPGFGGNPVFVNTETLASTTAAQTVWQFQGCYAPSVQKFYITSEDQRNILSFDLDGNLISTISLPSTYVSDSNLVYDADSDRVFGLIEKASDLLPPTILIINPNTDAATTASTGLSVGQANGGFYQSPGVIWVQTHTFPDSAILGFETSGMTSVGSVTLVRTGDSVADRGPSVSYPNFVNGSNGKLYISATRPTGDFTHYDASIFEIDPSALTVDNIFNLTADASYPDNDRFATAGMIYKDGFIFAMNDNGNFCKINTSTRAITCISTIPNTTPSATMLGLIASQMYLADTSGNGFHVYDI